jgi:hypothetical protein
MKEKEKDRTGKLAQEAGDLFTAGRNEHAGRRALERS